MHVQSCLFCLLNPLFFAFLFFFFLTFSLRSRHWILKTLFKRRGRSPRCGGQSQTHTHIGGINTLSFSNCKLYHKQFRRTSPNRVENFSWKALRVVGNKIFTLLLSFQSRWVGNQSYDKPSNHQDHSSLTECHTNDIPLTQSRLC